MDAQKNADRILNRAESLYRALHAGQDVALQQARELRSTLDVLISDLTLAQFSPMAQARADLAKILTTKSGVARG